MLSRHSLGFGVLACLAALASRPMQAEKPNIILIMADDVGVEAFGCYGGTSYATPNLDRLAETGMRFEQCHSQPLCTPSRVKLMTGMSNARNYIAFSILRPGETTFGHLLKSAGYATCVVGKWQLYGAEHYKDTHRGKGTLPEDAGFDTHCLWQVEKLGSRFWGPTVRVDGKTTKHDESVYGPDLYTAHLLEFVEKNKDGPFFAYFPMALVHNPFVPTPDSEDREAGTKVRRNKKHFKAMVEYTDKIVGRIAKKLEELGIAANTLLLFTGDNGTNRKIRSKRNGREVQGGKGKTTNAGTHVPLIASWPGTIAKCGVSSGLIGFGDFMPTFVELAGLRTEMSFDGRSFAGVLRGEKSETRPHLMFHYHPRPIGRKKSRAVRFARGERYKLYEDGRMFDLKKDPLEEQALDPKATSGLLRVMRIELKQTLAGMPRKKAD